jgi:hypothetical protein
MTPETVNQVREALEWAKQCATWYCKGPYGPSPDPAAYSKHMKALRALDASPWMPSEREKALEKAARRMFDAEYRDRCVTEHGRTTPEEMEAAYQHLGEVLGNFGFAASALALSEPPHD